MYTTQFCGGPFTLKKLKQASVTRINAYFLVKNFFSPLICAKHLAPFY